MRTLLLQILDYGHLADAQGRRVDFTNTLIVATSNLEADFISEKASDEDAPAMSEKDLCELHQRLSGKLTSPLISRLAVVPFFDLTDTARLGIVAMYVKQIEERLAGKGIKLSFPEEDAVPKYLLRESDARRQWGGRYLESFTEAQIIAPLSKEVLARGSDRKGPLVAQALLREDGVELIYPEAKGKERDK